MPTLTPENKATHKEKYAPKQTHKNRNLQNTYEAQKYMHTLIYNYRQGDIHR